MSQMHITLPSNSSMKFFPNNTLTNYTTRLHAPLELGEVGMWEVGLSEIHYPHSWFNIPNFTHNHTELDAKRQEDYSLNLFKKLDATKPIQHMLDPGHYTRTSDVVRVLQRRIGVYADMRWDKTDSKVRVNMKRNRRFTMSEQLAGTLGLPTDLRGGKDAEFAVEGRRILDKFPDIGSLYVYCDIVTHQLVGDSSVPLLRIVPISGKAGDIVSHVYENIQYVPVRGGTIQNIEVDIRDDTGQPIPFESGRVVVTLHLRRTRLLHLQP